MKKLSIAPRRLRNFLAALACSSLTASMALAEPEALPELPGADSPEEPASEEAAGPHIALPPYMVEEPFTPFEALPDDSDAAEETGDYRGYPPPPHYIYEPPPPPPPPRRVAAQLAPTSSLWLGGRLGVMTPFGKLDYDYPDGLSGPNWATVAGPGASFELDLGVRVARHFIIFGLWEAGALTTGRGGFLDELGKQSHAQTHLFGAGFRFSSHPNETGLALEIALGFRSFQARYEDGSRLSLLSPIEARMGVGADVRVARNFTVSPMLQISNGSFLTMHLDQPGLPRQSLLQYEAAHGTLGLAIGGHFDLFASHRSFD